MLLYQLLINAQAIYTLGYIYHVGFTTTAVRSSLYDKSINLP